MKENLEARLRDFYEAAGEPTRSSDQLWQVLAGRLDEPRPEATPLPTANERVFPMKKRTEADPFAPETPAQNEPKRRAWAMLAGLAATIVVAVGLLAMVALTANKPDPTRPPTGSGGQILGVPTATPTAATNGNTPTIVPSVTAPATALVTQATPTPYPKGYIPPTPTPLPGAGTTSRDCTSVDSLTCAFRNSDYAQIVEQNLGDQPNSTQTFQDFAVTVRRVYASRDTLVVGFTINAPPTMNSLWEFQPQWVLKDANGQPVQGIVMGGGMVSGPSILNQQGFVVHWQFNTPQPAFQTWQLEISHIQRVGGGLTPIATPAPNQTTSTPFNPAPPGRVTTVPIPTMINPPYLDNVFKFDLKIKAAG